MFRSIGLTMTISLLAVMLSACGQNGASRYTIVQFNDNLVITDRISAQSMRADKGCLTYRIVGKRIFAGICGNAHAYSSNGPYSLKKNDPRVKFVISFLKANGEAGLLSQLFVERAHISDGCVHYLESLDGRSWAVACGNVELRYFG